MGGILENIINSKSKTFITFCFCFLLGVLVISLIDRRVNFVWLYLLSFIILSFMVIYWKNFKFRFILICLGIVLLGVWRYELAIPFLKNNISNFSGRTMVVQGYVETEPDLRQDRVNYIVKVVPDEFSQAQGKIYFRANLYPRYNYGDKLKIVCELELPKVYDNFHYDKYLANLGVFVICNKPLIEKIGEGEGNFLMSGILFLKNKVAEKVNSLWLEPAAGFMAGILYGYRGGLGSLNELFARTGITHIIAISGYNISIIVSILLLVFVNFSISRKKSFWIITVGIVLFTIFTGASASVVRACVMGVLVLIAKQIGRLSRIGNVLIFTAVTMVLINPFVLVWDAGFQLSFLSTLGLVYLSPIFFIILRSHSDEGSFEVNGQWNTKKVINLLYLYFERFLAVCNRLGMTESLSAIIATLPLILFQFGRFSIVALPVNLLVLWIIPFLMLGGFLAVFFSLIFFPLGQVIAWVTWVGIKYVISVVEFFGGLKFSALDITIPWWLMIMMYLAIIYVIWRKKLTF